MSDKNILEIANVVQNTKDIYLSDSTMNVLIDFERVLDQVDMYAFKYWTEGELIEGPIVEKYFVTCRFMWPKKHMPDPSGARRLLQYDAVVTYENKTLVYPIKIENPDDYRPNSKKPKLAKAPVCVVSITLPKQLMRDIYQGSVEIEGESIDVQDLNDAYEEELDKVDTQAAADEEGIDTGNDEEFDLDLDL